MWPAAPLYPAPHLPVASPPSLITPLFFYPVPFWRFAIFHCHPSTFEEFLLNFLLDFHCKRHFPSSSTDPFIYIFFGLTLSVKYSFAVATHSSLIPPPPPPLDTHISLLPISGGIFKFYRSSCFSLSLWFILLCFSHSHRSSGTQSLRDPSLSSEW